MSHASEDFIRVGVMRAQTFPPGIAGYVFSAPNSGNPSATGPTQFVTLGFHSLWHSAEATYAHPNYGQRTIIYEVNIGPDTSAKPLKPYGMLAFTPYRTPEASM